MQDSSRQIDSEAFLAILYPHLRQVGDRDALAMESNLYELGLDSMAAVNLLLELEESYQVTFPDALLTDATFETPMALRAAVLSLLR